MWGQKSRRTRLAQRALDGYNVGSFFRWTAVVLGIGAAFCVLGKAWIPVLFLSGGSFVAYKLISVADSVYSRNADDTFTANLMQNHMDVSTAKARRMAQRKNHGGW